MSSISRPSSTVPRELFVGLLASAGPFKGTDTMMSLRLPSRSTASRLAPSARKASPSAASFQPRLEALEDRVVPALLTPLAPLPTSLVINPIAPSIFSLFTQQETVTTQTNVAGTNLPATQGQVTITDGGQTQVVQVNSSGQANATFTFSFFQEMPLPHSVGASFTDPGNVYSPSTATSVQTPNNTFGYVFQIAFDLLLAQSLGIKV